MATRGRRKRSSCRSLVVGHDRTELEEDGLACAGRDATCNPMLVQLPAPSLHDHVDALSKACLPQGPVPAPMHEETACKRLAVVLPPTAFTAIFVASMMKSLAWHHRRNHAAWKVWMQRPTCLLGCEILAHLSRQLCLQLALVPGAVDDANGIRLQVSGHILNKRRAPAHSGN